jgi:hypothetical protein
MVPDSESFVEWCTTGRLSGARNVALEVPGVPFAAPEGPVPVAPARRKAAAKPARTPRKAKAGGEARPAKKKPVARGKVAGKKKAAGKKAARPAKARGKAAKLAPPKAKIRAATRKMKPGGKKRR